MDVTFTECHYTHHPLLTLFLLLTYDSVSTYHSLMKLTTPCRWVCSVPVRITRNFPFLPLLLIKYVSVQRINLTVEYHIASLVAQRSHFHQTVPSPVPSICPISSTVTSSWAVLTEARCSCPINLFYPSGSTINTLITILTNHSDPTPNSLNLLTYF